MKSNRLDQNNISNYSSYVSEADDYIDSDSQLNQHCNFCSGININRCLMISVQNKHNEQPNKYLQRIQKIMFPSKSPSSLLTKYEQVLKSIDREEKIDTYFGREMAEVQIKEMIEYYKFRKFVPLFADGKLADTLHLYYYEKLKIHYNEVKKRLNITIDPTEETQLSFYDSQYSKSNVYMKSKILIDLVNSTQTKEQTTNNMGFYQTQSKALDDLMKVLVSNQKFKSIKALNVMNEWQKTKKTSKQMFRDHILGKKKRSSQFVKKINNKILITFFSRDVKSGLQTKFQNHNSRQKLLTDKVVKSKDLKFLLKDKDKKIVSKFQKTKEQILYQQSLSSKRQLNSQKKRSSKKDYSNVMPLISKLQPESQSNHKYYNKKSMNPSLKKINFKSDIQKNQLFNKISSKLVFKSPKPTKQYPYQQNFLSIHKVERSKSQMKLKRQQKNIQTVIKQKHILPSESSPLIKSSRRHPLDKLEKANKQTLQKPRSRRKSLDLTKLKTTLTPSQKHLTKQRQDSTRKQQIHLPHRYKILDDYQKNKIQANMIRMIRTTNVSPTNRKSQHNQIQIQKDDNIVSIKKKKIQMLKRRMETQRKGITQFRQ